MVSGNGGAGAALGFVGQIEIFEFGLLQTGVDLGLEGVGEFALVSDGFENGLLAIAQLGEILVPLLERS